MVAAIRVHAAKGRLDGDFIGERLPGKQRFLHAIVDRGWRERGGCARERGERLSDMLATQLGADTGDTQPPKRRQTLESGASFCTEWDDEAGSAVRYCLSLDGKNREQHTWSKDLQVHLVFFFLRDP